jgi:hypothetical protein
MSTTCALHDSSDPDRPQKSDVEQIPIEDRQRFTDRLKTRERSPRFLNRLDNEPTYLELRTSTERLPGLKRFDFAHVHCPAVLRHYSFFFDCCSRRRLIS